MKYILDSNIWIYAGANLEPAVETVNIAAKAEWSGFSAISRIEILGYPDLSADQQERFGALLSLFSEVSVSREVVDITIDIRKNKRIKIPDAIIAASALYMDAVLFTRNEEDFKDIPDLKIQNPFT